MDAQEIRTIEEISLNAWPCLQQILFDGWILRFAEGYTKRANSVNPIYPSLQGLEDKIKRCEQIYVSKNLNTVFRLTPLAPAEIDRALEEVGYRKRDAVSVQIKDLLSWRSHTQIEISTELTQEWLDQFVHLSHLPLSEWGTLIAMLQNIAAETCFAMLRRNYQVVSCGLGVLEEPYLGLFEIVTAKRQRRKGYTQELIGGILDWGKSRGATHAYLQVQLDNQAALNLYSKLGFQEGYQYYYRIKVGSPFPLKDIA